MRKVLLFVLFAFCMVSCYKDDGFEFREQIVLSFTPIDSLPTLPAMGSDGSIVLGNRLQNPYSVANMRLAFVSIKDELEDAGINEEDITTTHFYVRFKPDNEEELFTLKESYSDYDLYEYPLDYEISGRTSYHDPSLPDTIPTYQYMSIDSLSWNLIPRPENVDYDVLERLFIPDEDLELEATTCAFSTGVMSRDEAIDALVNASMSITGNLEDDTSGENSTMGSNSSWYPSGRITAYDDIVNGQIPLKGVKVRARRWFTTHTATTDENGYFQCSKSFKGKANYSIVWEGSKWDIRDGILGQAYYNGPKKKGVWNLEIANDNHKSVRYAAIHRAAYRFFEGNTYGLSRPLCKQKISYVHELGDYSGIYICEIGADIFCDIKIYKGGSKTSDIHEIISTTYHELGHAAHFTNQPVLYGCSRWYLQESWASFVAYYLSMKEYNELGYPNGPFDTGTMIMENGSVKTYLVPDFGINRQYKEIKKGEKYLPFFIDFHDDDNQREIIPFINAKYSTNGHLYFPNDLIHNVPAALLENIVFRSFNFYLVKSELLRFYETYMAISMSIYNLTPNTINEYFDLYEYKDFD